MQALQNDLMNTTTTNLLKSPTPLDKNKNNAANNNSITTDDQLKTVIVAPTLPTTLKLQSPGKFSQTIENEIYEYCWYVCFCLSILLLFVWFYLFSLYN